MALKKKIIQDELANIKNQIDTDFLQIVSRTKYSFFAVPLLVFSMIDYLGSLYKGENTSKNAVSFMREYFSRGNKSYLECSGILYFVYRHGLIHQRIPKLTQLKLKGDKLSCYITNSATTRHLRGFKMINKSAKGLIICTKSLVVDLKHAVEEYKRDILSDRASAKTLRNNFSKAYKDSRVFNKENLLLADPKKKYLEVRDFNYIRKQLKNPLMFK